MPCQSSSADRRVCGSHASSCCFLPSRSCRFLDSTKRIFVLGGHLFTRPSHAAGYPWLPLWVFTSPWSYVVMYVSKTLSPHESVISRLPHCFRTSGATASCVPQSSSMVLLFPRQKLDPPFGGDDNGPLEPSHSPTSTIAYRYDG